jgi:hypothetical protein
MMGMESETGNTNKIETVAPFYHNLDMAKIYALQKMFSGSDIMIHIITYVHTIKPSVNGYESGVGLVPLFINVDTDNPGIAVYVDMDQLLPKNHQLQTYKFKWGLREDGQS